MQFSSACVVNGGAHCCGSMSDKSKQRGEQQTLFDASVEEADTTGVEKPFADVVRELDACQKELLATQAKLVACSDLRVELCHDLLNRGVSRTDLGKLLGITRVRVSQILNNNDDRR